MLRLLFDTARGLLIGTVGGALFALLDLPLPWTLGALSAATLVALSGRDWLLPASVQNIARPALGVMAGSAFTPLVIVSIASWWPAIAMLVAYAGVVTAVGYWYLRRIAGLDHATAFFASAPGGLGELSLLGATLGADVRTLVLVHSIRIVVVVFTIPFVLQWLLGAPAGSGATMADEAPPMSLVDGLVLVGCGVFGYLLGQRLKLPGGVMLPALVLSAAAHGSGLTAAAVPYWVVALVQVVIGSVAGARFKGVGWREVRPVIVRAIVWAFLLVASTLAAAALAASLLEPPLASLTLAFSPGGMAEMTVIAFAIGSDVAFVVTCQACRILAIFLAVPFAFRLTLRRGTT